MKQILIPRIRVVDYNTYIKLECLGMHISKTLINKNKYDYTLKFIDECLYKYNLYTEDTDFNNAILQFLDLEVQNRIIMEDKRLRKDGNKWAIE